MIMGEEGTAGMKRRRHTPEQVVRKLREADRLRGEGKTIPEVAIRDHLSLLKQAAYSTIAYLRTGGRLT